MAQYQNEYEGIGNALMGIGGMYYTASEKRKEEERLRKEKEDERKYLSEEAAKEWERKAPLELLRQQLAEARIASAEAEKSRPKYTVAGDQLITQMRVPGEGGEGFDWVEGREKINPLNPYQQRPAAAPRPIAMDGPQGPGMYVPDGAGGYTKVGKPLPKAAAAATKDPNVLPISARAKMEADILAAQNVLDASSDSDLISKRTTRAAEQAKINAQRSVLDKYSPKAPVSSGGSLMSGLFDAIKDGVRAAPLGKTEESAARAAMDGAVPVNVAAQSIAASTGEPVRFMGSKTFNPPTETPKAKENAKQVAPFSDMVNAFIKKQGREPTATERVALRKKYDAWLAANKE